MKFRIGLIVFIILIVLIGAAAFLLLPKGGSKNGIYFKTYDGVYAKITGTVRGGSNSITLSDLTYSEGAVPTADELASWQVNLEFGDSDEITITIRVENKNTDSLYVIFKDDNQTINNVTKTILNDGRTYNSGKIIILQSNSDTTVFTVNFRKNQDVITNIRYNYNIELKPELTYSDIQDGGVEAEEDSGYTFTYKDSNNTAEVTGLAAGNNTTILDIPSVVAKDDKVYTVTSIGNDAFADCINIISVTIPNGVVKLGNRVFKGCTRLTEINLSNTITTVGTYLFSGCTNLEEYNIPTSLRKLNSRMFENCTKITEFTFPANITTLGDYVFNGLSFETLTIPDTITTLTENTFSGIENIGELTLSYYVTSLGGAYAGLFANVANINKATIVLTDKGNELGAAFCGASTLKEVEISAGVTSIGGSAFRCCYAITSIEIPEGVESIGGSAFYDCTALINVEISDSVLVLGLSAFENCQNLLEVTFGDNSQLVTVSESAFKNCVSLTHVEIPNSVTFIGASTFSGCGSLESMTLPFVGQQIRTANDFNQYPLGYIFGRKSYDGSMGIMQRYIGETKTQNTDVVYHIPQSLKSVTITGGNILTGAFYNCFMIEAISIPDVDVINLWSFWNCSSLKGIKIPSTVTEIKSGAFNACVSLSGVYIDDIESWLRISFQGQSNPLMYAHHLYLISGTDEELVTNLTIPQGITEIKPYAFRGCTSIKDIVIPDYVTTIGTGAFYECSKSLISIVVEANNETFDSRNNCNAIIEKSTNTLILGCKNTIIPQGITTIGESAFQGCVDLTEIELPEGIVNIAGSAFRGCTGITKIIIPNSISGGEISSGAFDYCYSLAVVYNLSNKTIQAGKTTNGSVAYYAERVVNSSSTDQYLFTNGGVVYYIAGDNEYHVVGLADKTKTSITIDSRATVIKARAFYNCSNLTSVSFGENSQLTTIEACAFEGCVGLTEFTIPQNVSSVSNSAFNYCDNLEHIFVDVNNQTYDSRDNSNAIIETETNTLIIGCKGTTIPLTVTVIGEHAFSQCRGLECITIPENVTEIGKYAFRECKNLSNVTFLGTALDRINDYTFYGCIKLCSIDIPQGVKYIGKYSFYDCGLLKQISLPSSILNIQNYAFYECYALTEIVIPSVKDWLKILFTEAYTGSNPLSFSHKLYTLNNGQKELVTDIVITAEDALKAEAFMRCTSLRTVYIYGDATISSDSYSYPFDGCASDLRIYTNVVDSNSKPSGWGTYWNYYAYNKKLSVIWNTSFEEYQAIING